MDELDRVLAGLKREYEPDDEAPKRVRALLGGSLSTLGTSSGGGSAGSESIAPGANGGVATAHSTWLGSATLKGTVIALAVGGAAAVGVYARAPEKVRPAAVVLASAPPPAVPAPTQPSAEPRAEERLQAPPVHEGPSTTSAAAPAKQETSTVARRGHTLEELQLLSSASQALRAGQLEQAERALETHRARYPTSALARERTGLSLELECTRGATAALRAEAERFVRADQTSPISSSVQKKCLP